MSGNALRPVATSVSKKFEVSVKGQSRKADSNHFDQFHPAGNTNFDITQTFLEGSVTGKEVSPPKRKGRAGFDFPSENGKPPIKNPGASACYEGDDRLTPIGTTMGSRDGIIVEPKIIKRGDTVIKSYVDEKTGKIKVYECGMKLEVGDINSSDKWYPAKVMEVDKEENKIRVHYEKWSSRFDEWIKMDSSRLRPSANTNVVKIQFKVGERVEALWNNDGVRYPGFITHVFPNQDYYEILFDDGIKCKKKSSHIFKNKPITRGISRVNSKESSIKSKTPLIMDSSPASSEVISESKIVLPSPKAQKVFRKSNDFGKKLNIDTPPHETEGLATNENETLVPTPTPCNRLWSTIERPVPFSIFTPPPTDLGKRKRTVRDYALLVKQTSAYNSSTTDESSPFTERRGRKKGSLANGPSKSKSKTIVSDPATILESVPSPSSHTPPPSSTSSVVDDLPTDVESEGFIGFEPQPQPDGVILMEISSDSDREAAKVKKRVVRRSKKMLDKSRKEEISAVSPVTPEKTNSYKRRVQVQDTNVQVPLPAVSNCSEEIKPTLDTPPSTDLGKRKRTVHDYAMLLKTSIRSSSYDDETSFNSHTENRGRKRGRKSTKFADSNTSSEKNVVDIEIDPAVTSPASSSVNETFTPVQSVVDETPCVDDDDDVEEIDKEYEEPESLEISPDIKDLIIIKVSSDTEDTPTHTSLPPKRPSALRRNRRFLDNSSKIRSKIRSKKHRSISFDEPVRSRSPGSDSETYEEPSPALRRPLRRNSYLGRRLRKARARRTRRQIKRREKEKGHILNGITSGRVMKIRVKLMKRRCKYRLKSRPKIQDVKVDIINCICDELDEFGFMVQCEQCNCWQHGYCFGITNADQLPKGYVCDSCRHPRNELHNNKRYEWGVQHFFKTGKLPSHPFFKESDAESEKFFVECNMLNKRLYETEDLYKNAEFKLRMAQDEPPNSKIWQFDQMGPPPWEVLQEDNFHKVLKPVVRKLLYKHRSDVVYKEKLRQLVAKRTKFKEPKMILEEFRCTIRRFIGPKFLIMLDKFYKTRNAVCWVEDIPAGSALQLEAAAKNEGKDDEIPGTSKSLVMEEQEKRRTFLAKEFVKYQQVQYNKFRDLKAREWRLQCLKSLGSNRDAGASDEFAYLVTDPNVECGKVVTCSTNVQLADGRVVRRKLGRALVAPGPGGSKLAYMVDDIVKDEKLSSYAAERIAERNMDSFCQDANVKLCHSCEQSVNSLWDWKTFAENDAALLCADFAVPMDVPQPAPQVHPDAHKVENLSLKILCERVIEDTNNSKPVEIIDIDNDESQNLPCTNGLDALENSNALESTNANGIISEDSNHPSPSVDKLPDSASEQGQDTSETKQEIVNPSLEKGDTVCTNAEIKALTDELIKTKSHLNGCVRSFDIPEILTDGKMFVDHLTQKQDTISETGMLRSDKLYDSVAPSLGPVENGDENTECLRCSYIKLNHMRPTVEIKGLDNFRMPPGHLKDYPKEAFQSEEIRAKMADPYERQLHLPLSKDNQTLESEHAIYAAYFGLSHPNGNDTTEIQNTEQQPEDGETPEDLALEGLRFPPNSLHVIYADGAPVASSVAFPNSREAEKKAAKQPKLYLYKRDPLPAQMVTVANQDQLEELHRLRYFGGKLKQYFQIDEDANAIGGDSEVVASVLCNFTIELFIEIHTLCDDITLSEDDTNFEAMCLRLRKKMKLFFKILRLKFDEDGQRIPYHSSESESESETSGHETETSESELEQGPAPPSSDTNVNTETNNVVSNCPNDVASTIDDDNEAEIDASVESSMNEELSSAVPAESECSDMDPKEPKNGIKQDDLLERLKPFVEEITSLVAQEVDGCLENGPKVQSMEDAQGKMDELMDVDIVNDSDKIDSNILTAEDLKELAENLGDSSGFEMVSDTIPSDEMLLDTLTNVGDVDDGDEDLLDVFNDPDFKVTTDSGPIPVAGPSRPQNPPVIIPQIEELTADVCRRNILLNVIQQHLAFDMQLDQMDAQITELESMESIHPINQAVMDDPEILLERLDLYDELVRLTGNYGRDEEETDDEDEDEDDNENDSNSDDDEDDEDNIDNDNDDDETTDSSESQNESQSEEDDDEIQEGEEDEDEDGYDEDEDDRDDDEDDDEEEGEYQVHGVNDETDHEDDDHDDVEEEDDDDDDEDDDEVDDGGRDDDKNSEDSDMSFEEEEEPSG